MIDSSNWVYVATDNGILVSTDQGENWEFSNGLVGIQAYSVGLGSSGEILAGS